MSGYYRALRERVGTSLLLIPSVTALVRDARGRLLLQLSHDDLWGFPGGAIEPGETPAQAVVREVYEETGLHVEPTKIAGVVGGASSRVRYPNADEVEYVITVFECQIVGGTLIAANEETKRLQYVAVEDLPALAIAYPEALLLGTVLRSPFQHYFQPIMAGKYLSRTGAAPRDTVRSEKKLCLVATDQTLLSELLYRISLREDCCSVKYSAAPRAGMYLGRCFMSSDAAAAQLCAEYKAHPQLMVSLQDDDFFNAFRVRNDVG